MEDNFVTISTVSQYTLQVLKLIRTLIMYHKYQVMADRN